MPDEERHTVYVSLGSNIEREANIAGALAALVREFDDVAASSVYESEAIGYRGRPYFNLVVEFRTAQSPAGVTDTLRRIEQKQGRERGPDKFVDRTLDADILIYDDLAGEVEGVVLPRDEIFRHAYVLGPLAEIAGEVRIPGSGRTAAELWRDFDGDREPLRRVPFTWRDRELPARLSPS